ncbi:MAG: sensor histidine kinase, partial [Alphaproteobacteria bacterium]
MIARRSLRLRLVLGSAVSIALALSVAGVSLIMLFERQMLHRVEQELVQRWTELAAAFSLDDTGKPALLRSLSDPRYSRPYGGAYWQVSEAGVFALGSRSLWDKALSAESVPVGGAAELPGPNGGKVYAVARSVTLANRVFTLIVALDHAEVIEHRRAFERDVAFVLVPIGLVLSLGAWLQMRQNLGPLRRVRRQLEEIRSGHRQRMAADFPVELEPLVAELNLLLDRQDSLLRKARDRAATLAHGLKTPLTLLASQARRLGRDGHEQQQAVIDAQIETMRRHVDRELARARTAGRSPGGAFTPLSQIVDRLLRLMQHLPRGDRIEFVSTLPAGTGVRMEADDLSEVLGNLLDNARQWAA